MLCPISEEQVVADACHHRRHVAPNAGHVADGQTETHKACGVEDVDILQVRCATGHLLLVFVGAAEVGVRAQIVVALVSRWFVAIAPEGDVLCKVG